MTHRAGQMYIFRPRPLFAVFKKEMTPRPLGIHKCFSRRQHKQMRISRNFECQIRAVRYIWISQIRYFYNSILQISYKASGSHPSEAMVTRGESSRHALALTGGEKRHAFSFPGEK